MMPEPCAENHPRAEGNCCLAVPPTGAAAARCRRRRRARTRRTSRRRAPPADPSEMDADHPGELDVAAAHSTGSDGASSASRRRRGPPCRLPARSSADASPPMSSCDGEQDAGHDVAREHDAVRQSMRVEVDQGQHDADRREVEVGDGDGRSAPTCRCSAPLPVTPSVIAHHVTTANATPVIASTRG